MQTPYDQTFEVWVPARTSLFPDGDPGNGGGNGGDGGGGVTPPAPPQTPPETPTTNWEAAYKTLQRNHTTLQTENTALKGQINQFTADLATRANELTNVQNQFKTTSEQLVTLNSTLEALNGENGNLKATVARNNLIMSEFPQLATFEAQGLLPQAEGEEAMREVFTKFSATIGNIQESAVKQLLNGASPDPVGGEGNNDGQPTTLTSEQLWAKVVELSKVNSPEFNKVYDEYLDALEREGIKVSGTME